MKKITLSTSRLPLLGFALGAFLLWGEQGLAQPYMNGNLSTGTIAKNGALAPMGYTWSEVQSEPGATVSNTTTGVGGQITATGGNRIADDFTIPAGQSWDITKLTFYAYQTGYTGATSPFTELHVRIQNAIPSNGASQIVFGDLTTNVLIATSDGMMYRVPNTSTPAPGTTPELNRKIFKLEAAVNLTLPAGTYWIEWQQLATGGSNFSPASAVPNVRTMPGYNAIQWVESTSTWNPLIDTGNPSTAEDVALDMPFKIDYTLNTMSVSDKTFASGVSIYPNPVLNTLNISSEIVVQSAEVYDVTGRMVKSVKFNGLTTNAINVSSLTGGNYIVKLKSGEQTVARKFIKQ